MSTGIITSVFNLKNYGFGNSLAIDSSGISFISLQLHHSYFPYLFVIGNLYVATTLSKNVVLKVDTVTYVATIFVGGGSDASYCCDGRAAASATLQGPNGVALDASGAIFYLPRRMTPYY